MIGTISHKTALRLGSFSCETASAHDSGMVEEEGEGVTSAAGDVLIEENDAEAID